MIADDDGPDLDAPVPFARTYDFYKFLTGIALISIGGVFAFLDEAGTKLDPTRVVMILFVLGVSGVTSLLIAAYLSGLETRAVPRETVVARLKLGGGIAVGSLAMGLGGFMQTFGSAVLK